MLREWSFAFVLALILSLAPGAVVAQEAGSAPLRGRCLHAERPGKDVFLETCGNPELDAAVVRETDRLARIFDVRPNVRILDDRPAPQAWASLASIAPVPESSAQAGLPLGTVALGRRLLTEEIGSSEQVGLVLAGVMAHEFAHLVQWRLGSRLVGRDRELHADYLAGWYLARTQRRELRSPRKVRAFAKLLFKKGDHAWHNAGHHGMPNERVAAMLLGTAQAVGDLEKAFRAGEEFIARGPLRAVPKNVQQRRSPLWDRIKVKCTHPIECRHRTPCTHKVKCSHVDPCEHRTPCTHRVECSHIVPCTHKVQCVHRIPCEHRMPCIHRKHAYDYDADGNRVPCVHPVHNWDPKHDYDLKHEFDLQHPGGDRKHDFDFAHEFDPQHPEGHPQHDFDLAHPFDREHEFDLKHENDVRRVPRGSGDPKPSERTEKPGK